MRPASPISIHAPPRGATTDCAAVLPKHRISIHAPPRGATSVVKFAEALGVFQFTPLREGRRTALCGCSPCGCYFNSRPSARGDRWLYTQPSFSRHFNSRPSARGDAFSRLIASCVALFQFTPLREGRHPPAPLLATSAYFNSRPSARGDIYNVPVGLRLTAFQFTPLREGRRNRPLSVSA